MNNNKNSSDSSVAGNSAGCPFLKRFSLIREKEMGEENKLKPRQETNIVVIPVDRGQDSMRAFKCEL